MIPAITVFTALKRNRISPPHTRPPSGLLVSLSGRAEYTTHCLHRPVSPERFLWYETVSIGSHGYITINEAVTAISPRIQ